MLIADTPKKALQELIKNSVDLIILDVHMKREMDGFELAQIIKGRKKTEHIPIVFLTGAYISEEFKKKGFEIGAVDYLTKPIDDFLLINRINVYLKLIERERKTNIILQEQAKELTRAKEMAEAANEAKNIFFANISHEFRTPLNILLGSSQMIKYYIENDKVLNKEKMESNIKTQIQNCYRLVRLVNNLLDITKMDSGNFTLKFSTCNIVEVVESVVLSVVNYAASKNIQVVFDTDVEELYLSCDLDAIERIILNLLSNSIKFTPKGGNIFVNVKVLNNFVEISVKDSGIGIPQDKQQVIFADAKKNSNTQLSQVENFISQRVDVIIVAPVYIDASKPITDKAKAANIPIISLMTPFENQSDAVSYIAPDSKQAATLEMEYLAERMNYKGNVAIMMGPREDRAQRVRTETYHEVISKYPDMEIVAEQSAEWDRARGTVLMENWIESGKKIDSVAVNNDEMAIGALNTIEAAGKLGKITVGGIDATPDSLQYVKSGKLAVTVFQDAEKLSKASIDTAIKAAKGENVEKTISIKNELVTSENVDRYIAKWKNK